MFRLALRQTEGLIGSILGLLGLALAVPDHSTLSRRAKALEGPRPKPRRDGEPMHLLVDSTGLRLCGAGEWLLDEHGAKARRSWRKLHVGLDAGSGQIAAASLTAVLPHPKMIPRRRELSQPNAPWFHSPFAAAKPSRVTADAPFGRAGQRSGRPAHRSWQEGEAALQSTTIDHGPIPLRDGLQCG